MEYTETERPTVSKKRKIFGYAIGVLGILVTGVIIFGIGNKFYFGRHRLTQEERDRPAYESIMAFLAGKVNMFVLGG